MDDEAKQRQRILGLFLEEAQEYIDTIKASLSNLTAAIADNERINDTYRAAHSIKGSAAMLELHTISKLALTLEECFKPLRDISIKVDQKFLSLLNKVFKKIEELLYQEKQKLSGRKIIENTGILAKMQPTISELKQHFEHLLNQAKNKLNEPNTQAAEEIDGFEELFGNTNNKVETFIQSPSKLAPKNQVVEPTLGSKKAEMGQADFDSLNDLFANLDSSPTEQASSDMELDLFSGFFNVETSIQEPKKINNVPTTSKSNNSPIISTDLSGFDLDEEQNLTDLLEIADNSYNKSEINELDLITSSGLDSLEIINDEVDDGLFDEIPHSLITDDNQIINDDLGTLFDIDVEPASSPTSYQDPNLMLDIFDDHDILSEESQNFVSTSEETISALDALYSLIDDEPESSMSAPSSLFPHQPLNTEIISQSNPSNEILDLESVDIFEVETDKDTSSPSLADSAEILEDVFSGMIPMEAQLESPSASVPASLSEAVMMFRSLDQLLEQPVTPAQSIVKLIDVFQELDQLLGLTSSIDKSKDQSNTISIASIAHETHSREALANIFEPVSHKKQVTPDIQPYQDVIPDEFSDLDVMLKRSEVLGQATTGGLAARTPTQKRSPAKFDKTMRVSVKHLDNLNNLVGELVVNRNTLEQDQERMRQFLDDLLLRVNQLSDVGIRMQDLYEKSLLQTALLGHSGISTSGGRSSSKTIKSSSPEIDEQQSATEFDALEMDRFSEFHLRAQEMIELIVRVRESASDIEFVVEKNDNVSRQLKNITNQLQEKLNQSRMMQFSTITDRLQAGIFKSAFKYGKDVDLDVEGKEIMIDKGIIEHLTDPLTHIANNAIAHGIESAEQRTQVGKPPKGTIMIKAFHQGNQTVISISDDGAGINKERVKSKGIEKGLITKEEAQNMSDADIYALLFEPDFSTKDQADELAGRGVGMNVVLKELSEIRGTITTESKQGLGTTFTIRLPLTLSICKAFCCASQRNRIAFPMDGVEEIFDTTNDYIEKDQDGNLLIHWRDEIIPLYPLSSLLKYNRVIHRSGLFNSNQEEDKISVVVLRSGGIFLGIQVDELLGEQEIVIKQLEGPIPKPVGIAGATVLGDGQVIPIADVLELIDLATGRLNPQAAGNLWEKTDTIPPDLITLPEKTDPTVLIVDDSITVRELLSISFKKAGFRVEQARDGQDAWDKLSGGLPCDIVFCDMEMPRMNGLELLKRMHESPHLQHLPVAMLTSRAGDRHKLEAAKFGAKGYFIKPYLEDTLLDAAHRMIKGEVLLTINA